MASSARRNSRPRPRPHSLRDAKSYSYLAVIENRFAIDDVFDITVVTIMP